MNDFEELLRSIYANQVVIYKLLNQLSAKVIDNKTISPGIASSIKNLKKEADKVLDQIE